MKAPADLILLPQWVVPVEPDGALADHAVVIQDGRILDVLPVADAEARYDAAQTVALPGQALIPGLVNLHGHAAMSLLRGFADDQPLMTWLHEHI
ncbi:MAG: TRZ/ATZ family hydrolase, partial [Thiobacillus sp.]